MQPQIVRDHDVDWLVPNGVEPDANGESLGVKRLVQGLAGFFNQVVSCPPGWVIPVHSHDHDELFVVLSGSCEVDGAPMHPFDSAGLAAGLEYGIVAGDEGLQFMVVRNGAVRTTVGE